MSKSGVGLLGIDVGTHATKSVLVNPRGEVLSSASGEYSVDQPKPSWAQQWPETWEEALYKVIKNTIEKAELAPEEIKGVAIDGLYGGSGIPLDSDLNPIHPCLIWMDRRAEEEVEWVKNNIDLETLYSITDNYVDTYFGYTKMLWLKNNKPEIWNDTAKLVPPSNYLNYKLTGELAVDYSSAGNIGGIFDLDKLEWLSELCSALGIPKRKLPKDLVPSEQIIGTVTEEAAKKCSLSPGIPVAAGGVDAPMASLSAGAYEPGDNIAMMGTSTCWGIIHNGENLSKKLVSMPHVANPEKQIYTWGGSATSGAIANWFQEQFGQYEKKLSEQKGKSALQQLDEMAKDIPPGSEGLIALPYFKGERSPIWDSKARGGIMGLSLYHTKAHVFRSLLESTAYSLRHNIEIGKEIGLPLKDETGIVGGVSQSDLWVQILADVTGRDITIPKGGVGAALGSAAVAGVATGVLKNFSVIEDWISKKENVHPEEKSTSTYDRYYELYRRLYERNKGIMHELSS